MKWAPIWLLPEAMIWSDGISQMDVLCTSLPVLSISGRFHFFLCCRSQAWTSHGLFESFCVNLNSEGDPKLLRKCGQTITACQPSCRKLQNAKELRVLPSSKLWEDRVCICGWPLNCTLYIQEQCGLVCPQLNSNYCFSFPFPLIQKAGSTWTVQVTTSVVRVFDF
jgi:hypothetical protein